MLEGLKSSRLFSLLHLPPHYRSIGMTDSTSTVSGILTWLLGSKQGSSGSQGKCFDPLSHYTIICFLLEGKLSLLMANTPTNLNITFPVPPSGRQSHPSVVAPKWKRPEELITRQGESFSDISLRMLQRKPTKSYRDTTKLCLLPLEHLRLCHFSLKTATQAGLL